MEIDDRKIMCKERHEAVVRERIQREEGQDGEGNGAEKRVLDKHLSLEFPFDGWCPAPRP